MKERTEERAGRAEGYEAERKRSGREKCESGKPRKTDEAVKRRAEGTKESESEPEGTRKEAEDERTEKARGERSANQEPEEMKGREE